MTLRIPPSIEAPDPERLQSVPPGMLEPDDRLFLPLDAVPGRGREAEVLSTTWSGNLLWVMLTDGLETWPVQMRGGQRVLRWR